MEDETPESLSMLRCLRCRGEMVEGWVPEHAGEGARYRMLHWFALQKYQPKKISSFRDLLQLDLTPGEYEQPRYGWPVVTMRCVRCGYLESFARPKETKEK